MKTQYTIQVCNKKDSVWNDLYSFTTIREARACLKRCRAVASSQPPTGRIWNNFYRDNFYRIKMGNHTFEYGLSF